MAPPARRKTVDRGMTRWRLQDRVRKAKARTEAKELKMLQVEQLLASSHFVPLTAAPVIICQKYWAKENKFIRRRHDELSSGPPPGPSLSVSLGVQFPELTLLEEHCVAPLTPVITGVLVAVPLDGSGSRYSLMHYSVAVHEPAGLEPYLIPHSLARLAGLFLLLEASGKNLLHLSMAPALSASLPPHQLTVWPAVVRRAIEWLLANSRHYREAAFDGAAMDELDQLAAAGDGQVLGRLLELQHGNRGGGVGLGGDEPTAEVVEPMVWASRTMPPVSVASLPMIQPLHPVVPLAKMLRLQGRLMAAEYGPVASDPVERLLREPGFLLRSFPWAFNAQQHADTECPLLGPRLHEGSVMVRLIAMLDLPGAPYASDHRFSSLVLNAHLRTSSDAVIGFAVKNFHELGIATGQELRAHVAAAPSPRETVMRRFLAFMPRVVSLEPYWRTRADELRSLVDQLPRPPSFYFTITVDCLEWPDLYAYIAGRDLADYQLSSELPRHEDRLWVLYRHPRPAESFLARKLDAFVN